ncbi:TetR/AcrR family transcriptional regulator [Ruania suaedae]|uniref:TetR/AcrR family transcriptional regulator n=1 Tax=Ruania suaedae TaxID=2897774 RepID=UPI001E38798C|nr:TetR/AcrR family transcriptional regulator [Ruania suaedae]UFU02310.1 TetR/AcrR family transcriptional regulator [Ruania suaedae]
MSTRDGSAPAPRSTLGGHARQTQIERAAAEVLSEVGYAAASVGRIAQRAGVSKGVITYHFASKDEILRRVALTLFEDCARHIATSVSDEMSPVARLLAQLRAELEFFSSRRIEFRAMVEVMSNHREHGFIHAFENISTQEAATLADLLRQGQAEGQFRAFDATEMAYLIEAAKNGALDRWASDETLDLAPMTATMLDFIEHAVRA